MVSLRNNNLILSLNLPSAFFYRALRRIHSLLCSVCLLSASGCAPSAYQHADYTFLSLPPHSPPTSLHSLVLIVISFTTSACHLTATETWHILISVPHHDHHPHTFNVLKRVPFTVTVIPFLPQTRSFCTNSPSTTPYPKGISNKDVMFFTGLCMKKLDSKRKKKIEGEVWRG